MGDKPVFRVGVAGLDPRDLRLIEIVFRHSQYNKYEFRLADAVAGAECDILIANPLEADGQRVGAQVREAGATTPVIAALPRGAASAARHAISIDRLTLQLLPILNRVVDLELLPAQGAAAPVEPGSPSDVAGRDSPAAPGSSQVDAGPDSQAGLAAASDSPPTPGRESQAGSGAADAAAFASPARSQSERESGSDPESRPESRPESKPQMQTHASSPSQQASPPSSVRRSNLVAFPIANLGEGAITQRLKVLVVDDSPTVRRQLTVAFDRLGLGCETVGSAAHALERLADEHFDLALVDVVMPDGDGYKLTREIKRDKHLRQIPVIILTSRSSPFDLARGALSGCDAYLTKPVPFRALEAAVVKQLRKSLAIDDLTGLMRTAASPDKTPDGRPESRLARFFRR